MTMNQVQELPRALDAGDNLCKALVRARSELRGTVFKAGRNEHQRYAYVGHEDVITGGARDALNRHGLVLVQSAVEYVGEIPGGKNACLLWRGVYTLSHESGESTHYTFCATTQPNDKSAFVASTSLDRTAYLRVLALAGSSEEDPEHDVHDRMAKEAAQAAAKAAQKPEPASTPAQAQKAPQEDVDAYRDMFLLQLKAQTSADKLTEWYREMTSKTYPEATKQVLWKSFCAQAKTHGVNPLAIAAEVSREKEGAK